MAHRQVSNSQKSIITPIDGATPKDLCPKLRGCKNEKCKKYHPVWAESICVAHLTDQCKTKGCKFPHCDWEELRPFALDKKNCIDHFSGLSFKP